MGIQKTNSMLRLVVCAAVVLGVSGLSSGQRLIDDFTDEDDVGWSILDYTEGESFGPATFDASGGAYHIASQGQHTRSGGEALVALWNDPASDSAFNDGYLQARVRADNRDTVVGITMRGGADEEGIPLGYYFTASANYGMMVIANNNGYDFDFISSMPTVGFTPGRDWIFKAGAIDDRLEFKAWRADREEPERPQITMRHRAHTSGQLGLAAIQSGGSPWRPFGATFDDVQFIPQPSILQAGDADQDYDFDQFDLVRVQQAAKYLTGQPATWGEGDWNGAPGGKAGDPPAGDGVFNQFDIIAAQQVGMYMTGPYPAVEPAGQRADDQASVVYHAATGEVAVDPPGEAELTSINIDSAAGIFTGLPAANLGGSFDNDSDNNVFKATFGGSFGSLSFGPVAQTGLSEEFMLGDLTVVGSLSGGGELGDVDLIYVPVPEPSAIIFAATALLLVAGSRCRMRYPH